MDNKVYYVDINGLQPQDAEEFMEKFKRAQEEIEDQQKIKEMIENSIQSLDEPDYSNEPIPDLRTGEKQGWDGLCQALKPVQTMPCEQLDKLTITGPHAETQILAGLKTHKEGSFAAVDRKLIMLSNRLREAAQELAELQMEIGWLKKLSVMKW